MPNPPVDKDPIKHVVLLMMENHSFDQMLGCLQQKKPELDGVDITNPRFNLDKNGKKVFQKEIRSTQIPLDPMHEVSNVLAQISDNNGGFIKDFVKKYPNSTTQDRDNVMGYYPLGYLPALHTLAEEFVVCDHWFSSLPGPTWPNRFFALSGTSSGRVEMPNGVLDPQLDELNQQKQKTIFDCLNEAGKSWNIYYHDFALSLLFTHQREPHNLINYRNIGQFFNKVHGPESEFPDFTFIEPKYLGADENDDHPPHDVMRAEKLIADVYNAIRSNPKLWESTLLVVTYDEHGGFYDHIQPPQAVPPDERKDQYTFDKLGVRVPALLISPCIKKGIDKTVYDHTSLLKYLIDKWQLKSLGERTNNANSISQALNFLDTPRQDCPFYISVPNVEFNPTSFEIEKWDINPNHKAIHFVADLLNENNTPPNALSFKAKVKNSIGRKLVKFGMWLERDAYDNHQSRIEQTCKITENLVKNVILQKPIPETGELSSLTLKMQH